MTSANVTEYRIENLQGDVVGTHRQNHLCMTHWGDLLVFTPPEDFMITAHGLDEDEEEWEDDPMNLSVFIANLINKRAIWNTKKDIMGGIKNK